ncbi:MAG: hypothetical protein HY823_12985 [Acidobacteria bacterium]|nr:hypothetical protein [Acidobacteriota bacterium]
MTPIALFLMPVLLAPLAAQAPSPTAKARNRPKVPAAAEPTPAVETGPVQGPRLLRSAKATLTLKGELTRTLLRKDPGPGDPPSKTVREQFEYQLPGLLEEVAEPGGLVRFTFTPSNGPGSLARLDLQDSQPMPGQPPLSATATRFVSATPIQLQALGRGQRLVPVSMTTLNLRGRVHTAAPVAKSDDSERPIHGTPFAILENGALTKVGTPALVWEGPSLWAWANVTGTMTAVANLDYRNYTTPASALNGRVTFRFIIEPRS